MNLLSSIIIHNMYCVLICNNEKTPILFFHPIICNYFVNRNHIKGASLVTLP